MPGQHEKPIGGHAVCAIGFSDIKKSSDGKHVGYFKIRNSWGPNWGLEGYFWMPYDYIKAGLCSDAWVITQNEVDLVKENNQLADPTIA